MLRLDVQGGTAEELKKRESCTRVAVRHADLFVKSLSIRLDPARENSDLEILFKRLFIILQQLSLEVSD